MPTRRTSILITGFGPFPGLAENATGWLVPKLAAAAQRRFANCDVTAEILPTEWEAAPRRLGELMVEANPAISLHFGVSRIASGFVIETCGRNVRSQLQDACGALPGSSCIADNGAEILDCTFPAAAILERLEQMGLPARLSENAGSYLCNAVLYQSLVHAAKAPKVRLAGFIHLPAALAGVEDSNSAEISPSLLDPDSALSGALQIISVCLDETSTYILR